MKHVVFSSGWKFGTDPFPAYRAELVYGRNKRDREFLPVKDIVPVKSDETGESALPEGQFKVIRTKEKGTILVVPGEDKTNRVLLFAGISGGFRGGESVLEDGTTGMIIKVCSAGNACESRTEIIAILEVGQAVVFHTYGRRTNEVYQYLWDGAEVKISHFSKEEWDNRGAIETKADEGAEVI